MKEFPLITAHTGCMGTPDNSLLSVTTGIACGADIIEDDLLVTKDGVLVLSHDDAVRLADGTEALISCMTYAELNERAIVPLTTLKPALELVRNAGKVMNLDVKSDACIGPLSDFIENTGSADVVFLSGCEYQRARIVMQCNPRLNKLLNADRRLFASYSYTDAVRRTCEQAVSAGCFGINIPYYLVQTELLELAHEYGLHVYIWTVNDEKDMRTFAEMGVQSITVRDVAALIKVKQAFANA